MFESESVAEPAAAEPLVQSVAAAVQPFKLPPPKPEILPVTQEMAREYIALFVNRRAFAQQSNKPGGNGKHYYFRPKIREIERWAWDQARRVSGKSRPDPDLMTMFYEERVHDLNLSNEFASLDVNEICKHLSGEQTINLFAINPETQSCKWVAIDADYPDGYTDLQRLRFELLRDDVEAALERSRRGAHLWIFCAEPVLAKTARIFIYHVALRLGVSIKGYRQQADGIEIFPRQDMLGPGELGNALRGPLGIHRATMKRYWFEAGAMNLAGQCDYLRKLRKLTVEELARHTATLSMPADFVSTPPIDRNPNPGRSFTGGFNILAYVRPRRKDKRNQWAQCPSCAKNGGDRGRDNLAIKRDDPRFYKCWAGCTKEMIREAVGAPPPKAGEF